MRRACAMMLSLVAVSVLPARGQELNARAAVDSASYLVGDAIHVAITLTHPKGATARTTVGDSLEGFTVLSRLPVTLHNDTTSSTGIVFSRYDSVSTVLPPIPFLFLLPGDSTGHTVSTNPLPLTVRTVPVDTTKDFHDLKPPLSIPISLAEILLIAGIVLLAAAVVYFAFRFLKKRGERPAAEEAALPARPAHVIAFEELGALKEKKLWQQGRIKEYYSEVTEILRRYIENRYHLQALEETTDEILVGLAGVSMPGDIFRAMEKVFRRADLVKFAKAQPGIPEHEETLAVAYETVERTKLIVVAPPVLAEAGKGVAGGN